MRVRIDRIKLITELARKEMTQKDLAQKSGVSRVTISYIKQGKSCSEDVANKIAEALDLNLNSILEN